MSLILRGGRDTLALLPLTAAVGVCDVVGPRAQIKWPNDVVVPRSREPQALSPARDSGGERRRASAPTLAKLAGILTEARPQEGWAVVGIGLNVAVRLSDLPDELRLTAATLGESPEMIEPTLGRLLDALERRLAEANATTLDAWRARDALRGREIAWGSCFRGESPADAFSARLHGRGRAEGIDDAGHLLVALAGGGHTGLDAGEVRLVRVEDG
jgi:BirA family biotin operon repressor/biotin-[acetyl-CoA-carboxylase] ligase